MSVMVEFSVDSEQFPLGKALLGTPPMHVELERVVPIRDAMIPFLWVTGDDFEAFEKRLTANEYVDVLDEIDDSVLYRVTWAGNQDTCIGGIVDSEGTISEAHGDTEWHFHVRFPDHDRLSQFYNYCTDHGIPIHIDRTYTLTERADGVHQFDLSQEQREALLLGLREGYFDTPSQVTLRELADELEISQQAMSNRIRRGTKRVLSKALLSTTTDFD